MKLKGIKIVQRFGSQDKVIDKAINIFADFVGITLMCNNFTEVSIKAFLLFGLGYVLIKSEFSVKSEEM